MKKKVISLALTTVMGLSMATSAFAANPSVAKVGSGDVDMSGALTAADSAEILQYTLDHKFGDDTSKFNLNEANYDGSIDSETGFDQITANDAVFVLSDVLDPQSNVYITVEAGDMVFNEIINEGVDDKNAKTVIETKALDFADSVINDGNYDDEITNHVGQVNEFIDKIEFSDKNGNKASIRDEQGWSKFESAVGGLVGDQTALAALKNRTTTSTYSNVSEIKEDYANAKKAFPASGNSSSLDAAGKNVIDIVGADFVKVEKLDDKGKVIGSAMNLEDALKVAVDNNLMQYDEVTINKLQELFGSKVLVTVKNPNTGYTKQAKVTVERR